MTFILLLLSLACAAAATVIGFGWIGSDPFDVSQWAGWISLSVVFFVLSLLVGAGVPETWGPRRRE